MTREEQINEYLKERNIPVDSLEANSIKEGIDWADEHPKGGLVSIDKVCKYLESLTYQDYDGAPLERYVSDYIINNLRKTMEE